MAAAEEMFQNSVDVAQRIGPALDDGVSRVTPEELEPRKPTSFVKYTSLFTTPSRTSLPTDSAVQGFRQLTRRLWGRQKREIGAPTEHGRKGSP